MGKTLRTPLIKPRTQGGTFYTFSSSLEDIGLNINELKNKIALSHYALVNIPEFTGNTKYSTLRGDYTFADYIQNYVLNMETILRNSDSYNSSSSKTVAEKVFWKFAQKMGWINFKQMASPNDEYYVENTTEFVKAIGLISAGAQRTDSYGIYNETFVQIPSSFGQTSVYFKTDEDINFKSCKGSKFIANIGSDEHDSEGLCSTGLYCLTDADDSEYNYTVTYTDPSNVHEIVFNLDKLREIQSDSTLTFDELAMSKSISDTYNFNAALIYYSIYDSTGVNILATNLYGILIFDTASETTTSNKYKFTEIKKQKGTESVNGTSYAFRLNIKASSTYAGDIHVNDNSTPSYEMSEDFNETVSNLNRAVEILKANSSLIVKINNDNQAIKTLSIEALDKINDFEKTINNINISGGGGEGGAYFATYGETTHAKILAALESGYAVFCKYTNLDNVYYGVLSTISASDNTLYFGLINFINSTPKLMCLTVTTDNVWSVVEKSGGSGSTEDCVHKTGDETIDGNKTFLKNITAEEGMYIPSTDKLIFSNNEIYAASSNEKTNILRAVNSTKSLTDILSAFIDKPEGGVTNDVLKLDAYGNMAWASMGISKWLGNRALEPTSAEDCINGAAYHNTTDKKSYIYWESSWYVITIDGADGKDGSNGIDGSKGLNTANLTLYRRSDSDLSQADCPESLVYSFINKTYTGDMNYWSPTIPAYSWEPVWTTQCSVSDLNDTVTILRSDWSVPTKTVVDGINTIKSFVFKRCVDKPDKPGANEGTYANPIPEGWYDSIPVAEGREKMTPVWMTSRKFSSDGTKDASWSDVVTANDTDTIDREWNNTWGSLSEAQDNPPLRTSPVDTEHISPDANHWYDDPIPGARFMAVRSVVEGKYEGDWEISQVGGENGMNTATVSLYQRADSVPTTYPGNVYYNFKTRKFSDTSTGTGEPVLNGWKTEIPEYDWRAAWCIQANVSSIDEYVLIKPEDWTNPPVQMFTDGISKFKSTVFRRDASMPDKPGDSEGSYSNPVPANWYDTIPSASGRDLYKPVWMTSRTFVSTGRTEDGQDASWSPVITANDTNDIEREWNAELATLEMAIAKPPLRTSPLDKNWKQPDDHGWYDEPITGAKFMAVKHIVNGEYLEDTWAITQIGGEGTNSALLTLYQRSKEKPTLDPDDVMYHFDTCDYTKPGDPSQPGNLNGWYTTVPKYSWFKCWAIQVQKSSTDSSVLIKSEEWSDPEEVFADGSHGLNTADLTLYKKSNETPTDMPLNGLIYNFVNHNYQGDRWDASLNGWSTEVPAYDWFPTWGIKTLVSSEDSTIAIPDSSWSSPVKMFVDGVSKFTSTVFKRITAKPEPPLDSSGTYENPVPEGWSDSVPDGSIVIPVWSTSRMFASDGTKDASWSPVICVNDSEYVDYEWNKFWATLDIAKENPPERTSPEDKGHKNPDDASWWDNPISDAKYMAVRSVSKGQYIGDWEITEVKGEHGKSKLDLALYQRTFSTPDKPGDMNYNINGNVYTPESAKGDWRTDIVPHTYDWSPLWVITAHKTLIGSVDDVSVYTTEWSDPIICVVDGSTGPEGDSYEYIYGRCEKEIPADASVIEIEAERQKSQPDYVPCMRFTFTNGSTLDVSTYTSAQGVDASNMYEFVASRRKHNNIWGLYSKPGLCSNWVHAGLTPEELEDIKQQVKAAIEEDIEDIREDLATAKSDINDASTRLHNLDDKVTGIDVSVNSITETAVFKNDDGSAYIATLIVRGIDASKGTIEDWAGNVADDKITVYSHIVDVSLGTISNRITVTDGSLANLDTSVGESFTTVQENINAHAGTLSLLSAHQGLQDASISGAELAINGLDASIKLTATKSYVDGSIGNVRAEYSAGDVSVRAQAMTAVTEARYISKLWSDGSTYLVDSSNYCLYYYYDNSNKVRLYSNQIDPTATTNKFYTDERYKNEWQNISGKTVYIAKHPDDITVGIPINESMSFIRQLSNEVNIAAIDGSAAAQIMVKASEDEGTDIVLNADRIHLKGDVGASKAAIETAWIANAKITDASIQCGSIVNADIDLANIHDASIYDASIYKVYVHDASIEDCSIIRGTVAYANMYDSSIKNAKIENGSIIDVSIGHVYIHDASIEDVSIRIGTISKVGIWDSSINYALIDTAWIKDGSINDCSIHRGYIEDASIEDASIIKCTISESRIWQDIIDNASINDSSIFRAKIHSAEINDGSIENAYIKDACIRDASIIYGTISEAGIWNANIHNGSIDNADIVNGEIDSAEIKDCSIGHVFIQDASVNDVSVLRGTFSKIGIWDASIYRAKIYDASIERAIINDASIKYGTINDVSIKSITLESAYIHDVSIVNASINTTSIKNSRFYNSGNSGIAEISSEIKYYYDNRISEDYPSSTVNKEYTTINNAGFTMNGTGYEDSLTYYKESGISGSDASYGFYKSINDNKLLIKSNGGISDNFTSLSHGIQQNNVLDDSPYSMYKFIDNNWIRYERNTKDSARNTYNITTTFDTSTLDTSTNRYNKNTKLQNWRGTYDEFKTMASKGADSSGKLLSKYFYVIATEVDASITNVTLEQLNSGYISTPTKYVSKEYLVYECMNSTDEIGEGERHEISTEYDSTTGMISGQTIQSNEECIGSSYPNLRSVGYSLCRCTSCHQYSTNYSLRQTITCPYCGGTAELQRYVPDASGSGIYRKLFRFRDVSTGSNLEYYRDSSVFYKQMVYDPSDNLQDLPFEKTPDILGPGYVSSYDSSSRKYYCHCGICGFNNLYETISRIPSVCPTCGSTTIQGGVNVYTRTSSTEEVIDTSKVLLLEPTILNDFNKNEVIDYYDASTFEDFVKQASAFGTIIRTDKIYRIVPQNPMPAEELNNCVVARYRKQYNIEKSSEMIDTWVNEGKYSDLFTKLDTVYSNWHRFASYDTSTNTWVLDELHKGLIYTYNKITDNVRVESPKSKNYNKIFKYGLLPSIGGYGWINCGDYMFRNGIQGIRYYAHSDMNSMYIFTDFYDNTGMCSSTYLLGDIGSSLYADSSNNIHYQTSAIAINGPYIKTGSTSDDDICVISPPSIELRWTKYQYPFSRELNGALDKTYNNMISNKIYADKIRIYDYCSSDSDMTIGIQLCNDSYEHSSKVPDSSNRSFSFVDTNVYLNNFIGVSNRGLAFGAFADNTVITNLNKLGTTSRLTELVYIYTGSNSATIKLFTNSSTGWSRTY